VNKSIIIAGVSALLLAGAAEGATAQSPASGQAAPAAQPAPPPPGFGGPGFRGGERFGRGDGDGRGFRGMRQRPTLEQVQQRNAQTFAQLDANRDGRVTQPEFQGFLERRRQERQRQAFLRFSGGQDSVTLDQLNARTAQRYDNGPARRGGPGAPPPPAPPVR
jgi:hypothetical protein